MDDEQAVLSRIDLYAINQPFKIETIFNKKSKYPSKAIRGYKIIKETADLLKKMRFSSSRGDYAEGEHVSVMIDPRWENDHSISVVFTCFAFGRQTVEWKERVIILKGEDEIKTLIAFAFLNSRGQACLPVLQPGSYTLSMKGCEFSPEIKPKLPKITAISEQTRLAASKLEDSSITPDLSDKPHVEKLFDGMILSTLRFMKDGVQIAFQTKEQALAGANVKFELIQSDSIVLAQGEVTLETYQYDRDIWRGVWKTDRVFAQPFKLRITEINT